jgi:hypothetical protein
MLDLDFINRLHEFEFHSVNYGGVETPIEIIEPPPERWTIGDVAMAVRNLTYGEVCDIADGLGIHPDTLHAWAGRS